MAVEKMRALALNNHSRFGKVEYSSAKSLSQNDQYHHNDFLMNNLRLSNRMPSKPLFA